MNATSEPSGETDGSPYWPSCVGERTDVGAVVVAIAVVGHGDDVQVARSVAVPRLVSSRRGHDGARIAQPADAGVLELAGRQVARRPGAVRRHDVDVVRAIEDPVLPVESAEESLDLAGRLPGDALGVVALVACPAGEGQPGVHPVTT
jgi:hypothetical protein